MSDASVWTRNFYPREGNGVGFDRVVFFSDAVFAIALTLIAVEIGLPEVDGDTTSPQVLWEALLDKGPRIGAFVVAFIWVAVYWRANHRFTMTLRGMNGGYVLSVLMYLGLVAFLPLPAAMLGEYPGNPLAVSLFAIYAGTVSTMEVVLILVAQHGDIYVAPLSKRYLRKIVVGSLTPVVWFLLSIPIAFLWTPVAAFGVWVVGGVVSGVLVNQMRAEPPADPPAALEPGRMAS